MNIEDLDDWDSSFLEEAAQLEQKIISSRNPILFTQQNLNNFSPPRELSLSQQFSHSHDPTTSIVTFLHEEHEEQQESELDRLKKELRRVSQDLLLLEKECAELKKDKQKKEEQSSPNYIKEEPIFQDRIRDSRVQNASTSTHLTGHEYPVSHVRDYRRTSHAGKKSERAACDGSNAVQLLEHPSSDHQLRGTYGLKGKNIQVNGISAATDLRRDVLIDNAVRTSNECSIQNIDVPMTVSQPKYTHEVGVQTETDSDCGYPTGKHNPRSQDSLLNKLSAIWEAPNSQSSGRSLVSKLSVTCAADFFALFRCMGMSAADFSTLEPMPDMHDNLQHVQSVEAAKVAHLYFSLIKIYNEMMPLDVLIDALLDLCTLDNVVVVHRSFCILHVILQQVLGWNGRSDKSVLCPGITSWLKACTLRRKLRFANHLELSGQENILQIRRNMLLIGCHYLTRYKGLLWGAKKNAFRWRQFLS